MQIQIQKRKSSASRDFPKKKDGQINDGIWEELMQTAEAKIFRRMRMIFYLYQQHNVKD